MNNKMCYAWMGKFGIVFLLVLFGLPSVFGEVVIQQLPVTQSVGVIIESPIFTHIQIGVNNSFYWNVYNLSSGLVLDNSSVSCVFRVFDKGGLVFEDVGVYGVVVLNDSVFSSIGRYSRFIQCNSSSFGDFSELSFNVAFNDFESSLQDAIVGSLMILVFVIFFIVSLSFAIVLDGENKFTLGPDGERLVELNVGKYIKLFLYLVSYLFFWMLSWASWQLADKFLTAETLVGVLRLIFIIETIAWIPVILIVAVIGFMKHFTDSEILNLSKRGIMPR